MDGLEVFSSDENEVLLGVLLILRPLCDGYASRSVALTQSVVIFIVFVHCTRITEENILKVRYHRTKAIRDEFPEETFPKAPT